MYREEYTTADHNPTRSVFETLDPALSRYDEDVRAVADDVIRERQYLLEPLLERYSQWIEDYEVEATRSNLEYTYDLLTLGVLWRCYGERAQHVHGSLVLLMSGLGRLRQWKPGWKTAVDGLRGWLARRTINTRWGHEETKGIATSACQLRKLLFWMDATGEYREEVARLRPLTDFLASRDRVEREWYLAQLSAFTARFGMMADQKLRGYTAIVNRLLPEKARLHTARETVLLLRRRRAEYHLSMVGTELLHRASFE